MSSQNSPIKPYLVKRKLEPQLKEELFADIGQSRQCGELTDTRLICNGGVLPVHGFILQSASPLFQGALTSQGENYPFMRDILLPDFPVQEIKWMLSLIYKGTVELNNKVEAQSLQETLQFFRISNIEFTFNQATEQVETSQEVVASEQVVTSEQAVTSEQVEEPLEAQARNILPPPTPVTSKRKYKPRKKKIALEPVTLAMPIDQEQAAGRSEAEETEIVTISDSDPEDESIQEEPTKKGKPAKKRKGAPLKTTVLVKLPRTVAKTSRKKPSTRSQSMPPPPSTSEASQAVENGQDSEPDSEDEDWTQPDYKDPEWFSRVSKQCQGCNKIYDRAAEASLCVTSHKSLRCYFCFRSYSTTDVLFRHFKRRHEQAGGNTMPCPFCPVNPKTKKPQCIPYKSVSCHVISVHLRTAGTRIAKSGKKNGD